ncbi:MAG: ATP-binding protein [Bacteroidaceae bacterium]|jgi:anti-sigma regulatory factor (Ser/Thr protein kinase)|nr:ATP-binding protein [Bacteroidaceae bacterium]MBQ5374190.1 ATP-binding protein [Bacteroidaceae bacterium]MEE1235103.1 ATP-binding protein [Bacteroidaceae bacterium]
MNLSTLIKQYFPLAGSDITIDVFDEKNIYDVYQRVVNVLTQHIDIETTVLQAMSYCFYEILDNVLTHSGKEMGTVITHYNAVEHVLSFLVADDGIGVQTSLSENKKYVGISEAEALRICIQDAITDGKGMGFGLYSTSLLVRDAGLRFEVRSGHHTMLVCDGVESITKSTLWQGTIIYLQLCTNKEINPAEVVANRTDVAQHYNETFLNDNELKELW